MAVCNDTGIILSAHPIMVVDLNAPIDNWNEMEEYIRTDLHDTWDYCNETELGPTMEHLHRLGYEPGNVDVSSPEFIDIVANAVTEKVIPTSLDNMKRALARFENAQLLAIGGNVSCLGEVFLNEKYWGRVLLDKILLPNKIVQSIGNEKELVFDLDNLDVIYWIREALPTIVPLDVPITTRDILVNYF
ncbi:MAG: hypothetical protein GXO10_04995, partial [Crenarchaeota archaeon]|nr:hypothetical protein [Thermoproteota archaeon]